MTKTAFVTGATGFTGGHLARRLIKDGWAVKVLARHESNYNELQEIGCEIVIGDLTDKSSFSGHLGGVDVLFHIAAFYRDEARDDVFKKVNAEGTRSILEASVESGVKKFIHCSTVGVHGKIDDPPADEDAPFKPGDIYQETKLQGEKLACEFISGKKIKGAVFRPVGIYGPGDRRFLKLFKMAAAPLTIMLGEGKVLYHLNYIDDLIDGIILLAEKKEAEGELFILAGERYTTIKELLDVIAGVLGRKLRVLRIPIAPIFTLAYISEKVSKLLGIKPFLYRRRLDFFLKDRAFSIDKAKRVLGYTPKVSLEEGLYKTAQWYKEQGWLK